MKKKILIIVSILVLILSFVGVFFLGKYFGNTKQTQCNAEAMAPVDQDGSSDVEDDQIVFGNDAFEYWMRVLPEKPKLTNLENDLTNQEKLFIVVKIMENSEEFKGAEVKRVLEENFGSDLNVKLENIKCICGDDSHIYDPKTDTYKGSHGHGGFGYFAYNYLENYEVIGDILKVKVKKFYYYASDVNPITEYYLSYDEATQNKNAKKLSGGNSLDYYENGMDYFKEVYKLEKDNLPVYVYTFEKVGDDFIFKGYEPSK